MFNGLQMMKKIIIILFISIISILLFPKKTIDVIDINIQNNLCEIINDSNLYNEESITYTKNIIRYMPTCISDFEIDKNDSYEEENIHLLSTEYNKKNRMKTYMSYKKITRKSSDQYKLQQLAYTDENGFRKVNDRYCIALGTYFSNVIGTHIDVILCDGTIIKCVLGDVKADKDTDSNNVVCVHDGSIIEFIIDIDSLIDSVRISGNVSSYIKFSSEIEKIIILNDKEEL